MNSQKETTQKETTMKEATMKNWIKRFALLAIVGSILSSAMLMGCGGGEDDDDTDAGARNTGARNDDD